MEIWTVEQRRKMCAKGKHVYIRWSELVGHIERISYKERWWTCDPKPVVKLERIYEYKAMCKMCYKTFKRKNIYEETKNT